MKRFNQNEIRVNNGGETNIRPLAADKSAQRHYTKAVAAIFAVIVLHFVSQSVFFHDEKTSLKIEAIDHRSVEIEPEYELPSAGIETEAVAKKPEPAVVTMPETVSPVVQTEPKPMPSRVVIRKKEPRESRAERLRRAERILTGI